MTERWSMFTNTFAKENKEIDLFIQEILALCKKHGFSIAHEDTHGSFVIEKYNDYDSEWFEAAMINIKEENDGSN
jgi:hypothetical protein